VISILTQGAEEFMSNANVKPGVYRHYKGPEYQIYEVAKHSETAEEFVVYRCLYGDFSLWVRPLAMFLESVTVNGHTQKRFEYVREPETNL
jgi:hypothetical protein